MHLDVGEGGTGGKAGANHLSFGRQRLELYTP